MGIVGCGLCFSSAASAEGGGKETCDVSVEDWGAIGIGMVIGDEFSGVLRTHLE